MLPPLGFLTFAVISVWVTRFSRYGTGRTFLNSDTRTEKKIKENRSRVSTYKYCLFSPPITQTTTAKEMSPRKSPRLQSDDKDAEVTHLREQVRRLTQENEKLRRFIADNGFSGVLSPKTKNETDREYREKRTAHRSVTVHAPKAKSPNTPARPGTPRAPGRGCSCKGNCSTRICGCVKKNIPCAEFCRCGEEFCQNSEPDKENIGDHNHQPQLSRDAVESLTKLSNLALEENKESEPRHPALELVNKRLDQIGKPRSLFSPDVADRQFNFEPSGDIESQNISLRFGDAPEAGEAEEEPVVEKLSDRKKNKKKKTKKEKNVNVDDRELNLEIVGDIQSEKISLGSDDILGAGAAEAEAVVEKTSDIKKNIKKKTNRDKNEDNREHKEEKETHKSTTTQDSKVTSLAMEQVASDFDPMKPRRQLSRSPLAPRTAPQTEQPMDVSEIPLPAPVKEEPEEEALEPEELKQDIVPDWDQHKANLVECTICRRKLYPHRIKKHEASCQNI